MQSQTPSRPPRSNMHLSSSSWSAGSSSRGSDALNWRRRDDDTKDVDALSDSVSSLQVSPNARSRAPFRREPRSDPQPTRSLDDRNRSRESHPHTRSGPLPRREAPRSPHRSSPIHTPPRDTMFNPSNQRKVKVEGARDDTVSLFLLTPTLNVRAPTDGKFCSYDVLVHRRSLDPEKTFPGALSVPGGYCDGHETFFNAIARETLEEAGIDITPFRSSVVLWRELENRRQNRFHMSFYLLVDRDVPFVRPLTVNELDPDFAPDSLHHHRWMSIEALLGPDNDQQIHPATVDDLQQFRAEWRRLIQLSHLQDPPTEPQVEQKAEPRQDRRPSQEPRRSPTQRPQQQHSRQSGFASTSPIQYPRSPSPREEEAMRMAPLPPRRILLSAE